MLVRVLTKWCSVLGLCASICLVGILFSGCHAAVEGAQQSPPSEPNLGKSVLKKTTDFEIHSSLNFTSDWQKEWWIAKTAKALRGGQGFRNASEVTPYLTMTPEDIVQSFISDTRFADTVLDFNLFFLGFKGDRVKQDNGTYEAAIYDLPHALSSAQSVLNGGDWFNQFTSLDQSPFLGPLVNPYATPGIAQDGDAQLPVETFRSQIVDRIRAKYQDLLGKLQVSPQMPLADFCPLFFQYINFDADPTQLGFSRPFLNDFYFSDAWANLLRNPCNDQANNAGIDRLSLLQKIGALNERLYALIPSLVPAAYPRGDVRSVIPFNRADFGISSRYTAFPFAVNFVLQNSSTNYDRKRAAYMLKRYFCDDLTPIGVEAPADHAQGAHASDPTCMACHYKLDPMAGFFRDYGVRFKYYGGKKNIFFDDNAKIPLAQYEAAWQNPAGSTRPLNVGYIRSSTHEELNSYGNQLEDLFQIIKTAPEVKRCVVKRMFEYFNSEEQVIDPAYLDQLGIEFGAESSSTVAFKKLAAKMVLGQTFSTSNPDPERCYDTLSGPSTGATPPCRIAAIVQTNCKTCHSATTGPGKLDLTQWVLDPQGSWTFAMLDDQNQQRTAADVQNRLLDRLSSSDPARRMPMGMEMPGADREALYLWAQSPQASTSGGQP